MAEFAPKFEPTPVTIADSVARAGEATVGCLFLARPADRQGAGERRRSPTGQHCIDARTINAVGFGDRWNHLMATREVGSCHSSAVPSKRGV